MRRILRQLLLLGLSVFCVLGFLSQPTNATTVWSGLTKTFSKSSFTDPTLPENQDRLTANVSFSRGSSGGLLNIATELFFDQGTSPADTLWATELNNDSTTVSAENHANLTVWQPWFDAYQLGPGTHGATLTGVNAVVHLLTDDIYLDIKFTSWSAGTNGFFSYERAEPAAAAPTGDYNGNGTVDAADYVVWRRSLGQNGVPQGTDADGNSSGSIDAGDYTYWRERFGNTVAGSGASLGGIPEPAGLCLLLEFLAIAASVRRR